MKRFMICMFVLSLVLAVGSVFADNLLANPGFESGTTSWNLAFNGASTLNTDLAYVHSGTQSIKTSTGSSGASLRGVQQLATTGAWTIPSTKIFRYRAWVLVPTAATTPVYFHFVHQYNGAAVTLPNVTISTSAWTEVVSDWFAGPTNMTGAYAGFQFQGIGVAAPVGYMDDLVLETADAPIITSTATAGGTITPVGALAVVPASSKTYTMVANFGYSISDVKVDGVSQGAIATYTFTNITANHTIDVTFLAAANHTISGHVAAAPAGGATVAFKATATGLPLLSTTTDASGNYSISVPDFTYYVIVAQTGFTPATMSLTVTADQSAVDFTLAAGRSIPKMESLLFSAVPESFTTAVGANTGPWPSYWPAGINFAAIATPTMEKVRGLKWERNDRSTSDGYTVMGGVSSPIPVNGATIVTAIRPDRGSADADNWKSIIDVFYNRMCVVIHNNNGQLGVWINGTLTWAPANTAIADKTQAIVSYVVQPSGAYQLFANGVQILSGTGTAMTSLVPNVPGGFANSINIGRNGPDGWACYNGWINDVFMYTTALPDADRQTLEADILAKLSNVVTHTITATAGTGGTISPSGAWIVAEQDNQTFTIAPSIGYQIADVKVDGVSQGAIATYTFTNILVNHTIDATFSALPKFAVTGKVTDSVSGNGIPGATVYVSLTANASVAPLYTVTTDVNGDYSIDLFATTWYVCASENTHVTSADLTVVTSGAPLSGQNIILAPSGKDIPQMANLLFSIFSTDLTANGATTNAWPIFHPKGASAVVMGTPALEEVDGVQLEKNLYTTGDGYRIGQYTTPVTVNGVTAVAVIKPVVEPNGTNWNSIIDVMYSRVILGIQNATGMLRVCRNGTWYDGPVIPDGQKTILSLVIQPTGEFKVWANAIEVMNVTATSDMTSLVPGKNSGSPAGFDSFINIGRNNPDGWTVYNGYIGDAFLYKTALTNVEREQLQSSMGTKFGIYIPVFTTVSGKVTLDDGVTPVAGAKISCIGNVMTNTTSGVDGTYTVSVEVGSYVSITASKDSYIISYPSEGQYDFTVGSTPVENKDFRMTAVNTITGIVKDESNKPIYNAVVQIGGVGGPGAVTDADGKYMITNIAIGSVELYADALGYADNTQTIDSTPAATGAFNVDITLTAKNEIGVIKNGGFEEATAGVPTSWDIMNATVGDVIGVTTNSYSGTYAGMFTPTETTAWSWLNQTIKVIPGSTYNFYFKGKADVGVAEWFPMFAFRNAAGDELAGWVSGEVGYAGWVHAPPTAWKQYLQVQRGDGSSNQPAVRLTPPAGSTQMTVWFGVGGTPFGGLNCYADDVVVDRVGPDVMPAVDVTSIKDLKATAVDTRVNLLGTTTVTLVPNTAGVFYIGEASRISGLRVVATGAVLNAGDTVTDLTGTVKKTAGGEVYLELEAAPVGTAGAKIAPLAMNNKSVATDAKALATLVKVWGKVTVSGSNFTITDGYSTPIAVLTDGATLPAGFDGSTAAISGVVSKDDAGNAVILLGGF